MCEDEFFSTVPGLNTRISEINVSRSTVRSKVHGNIRFLNTRIEKEFCRALN